MNLFSKTKNELPFIRLRLQIDPHLAFFLGQVDQRRLDGVVARKPSEGLGADRPVLRQAFNGDREAVDLDPQIVYWRLARYRAYW
jgi:hypothetical protein